jgi:hypothetical protein
MNINASLYAEVTEMMSNYSLIYGAMGALMYCRNCLNVNF